MKSSAIYNRINSDCKSDRSFGCPTFFTQTICVGASRSNSYEAIEIGVQRVDSENERTFFIRVDDKLMKVVTFNTKTKQFNEEQGEWK